MIGRSRRRYDGRSPSGVVPAVRRVSSVGQSVALVKRGSSVRLRHAAPRPVRRCPGAYPPEMAEDPVVSNPDHYRVVFENDRVRVLDYTDRPGDRTVPHRHPDSVMYTLTEFDRRLGQRRPDPGRAPRSRVGPLAGRAGALGGEHRLDADPRGAGRAQGAGCRGRRLGRARTEQQVRASVLKGSGPAAAARPVATSRRAACPGSRTRCAHRPAPSRRRPWSSGSSNRPPRGRTAWTVPAKRCTP